MASRTSLSRRSTTLSRSLRANSRVLPTNSLGDTPAAKAISAQRQMSTASLGARRDRQAMTLRTSAESSSGIPRLTTRVDRFSRVSSRSTVTAGRLNASASPRTSVVVKWSPTLRLLRVRVELAGISRSIVAALSPIAAAGVVPPGMSSRWRTKLLPATRL